MKRSTVLSVNPKITYMPQPHPQRINKIGPTQQEPKKVRMFFKSGNSTMLLAKLDHVAALQLESRINRFLREHGSTLEGHFIHTK